MNQAEALLAKPDRREPPAASPTSPFRPADDAALEALKAAMLRGAILATPSPGLAAPLRRAANEAAALAWLEPLPLLVFPCLFAELAEEARKHFQRQALLASRTGAWLVAA